MQRTGTPLPDDFQTVAERLTGPAVSNPRSERVKQMRKLARRSARFKAGLFIAEGPAVVSEALSAAGRDEAVVYAAMMTADAAERFPDLLEKADTLGIRFRQCSDDVVAELADTVHAQGIIVVCELLHVSLESVLDRRPRLLAVLSQIRDPGNAGTILRAADAAGADAVVLTSGSVDVYNPKTVRASAGSVFHLPVVIGEDLVQIAADARSAGLQIIAADGHRPARNLFEADLAPATAWVFGNEAWGMPDRDLADFAAAVPLYGRAESLNVAAAAAVCLYASAQAHHYRPLRV